MKQALILFFLVWNNCNGAKIVKRFVNNSTDDSFHVNVSAGYGVHSENATFSTLSPVYKFQDRIVQKENGTTSPIPQDQILEPSQNIAEVLPSPSYQVHEKNSEVQEKNFHGKKQRYRSAEKRVRPKNNEEGIRQTDLAAGTKIVEVLRVPAMYELHLQTDPQRLVQLNSAWMSKLNGWMSQTQNQNKKPIVQPVYQFGGTKTFQQPQNSLLQQSNLFQQPQSTNMNFAQPLGGYTGPNQRVGLFQNFKSRILNQKFNGQHQPTANSYHMNQLSSSFGMNQPTSHSYGMNHPETNSYNLNHQPVSNSHGFNQPFSNNYGLNQHVSSSYGLDQPLSSNHGLNQQMSSSYGLNQPLSSNHGSNQQVSSNYDFDQPLSSNHGLSQQVVSSNYGYDQPASNSHGMHQPLANSYSLNQQKNPNQSTKAQNLAGFKYNYVHPQNFENGYPKVQGSVSTVEVKKPGQETSTQHSLNIQHLDNEIPSDYYQKPQALHEVPAPVLNKQTYKATMSKIKATSVPSLVYGKPLDSAFQPTPLPPATTTDVWDGSLQNQNVQSGLGANYQYPAVDSLYYYPSPQNDNLKDFGQTVSHNPQQQKQNLFSQVIYQKTPQNYYNDAIGDYLDQNLPGVNSGFLSYLNDDGTMTVSNFQHAPKLAQPSGDYEIPVTENSETVDVPQDFGVTNQNSDVTNFDNQMYPEYKSEIPVTEDNQIETEENQGYGAQNNAQFVISTSRSSNVEVPKYGPMSYKKKYMTKKMYTKPYSRRVEPMDYILYIKERTFED